jgi:hypothetical protein
MPEDLQPEWQLKFDKQALVADGHGSFEGSEYGVALWCPNHSERQLLLALRVKAIDFTEDRVRPYHYYITVSEPLSPSAKQFPISFQRATAEADRGRP